MRQLIARRDALTFGVFELRCQLTPLRLGLLDLGPSLVAVAAKRLGLRRQLGSGCLSLGKLTASDVVGALELLEALRQLPCRRLRLGKVATGRVALARDHLKTLVGRRKLRNPLGQSRGLGNLATRRVPLTLGLLDPPLQVRSCGLCSLQRLPGLQTLGAERLHLLFELTHLV